MSENKHNQFTRTYGKYRLESHLYFLLNERPNIYEILDSDGKGRCTVFGDENLYKVMKEGETFRKKDVDEEIEILRTQIENFDD